MLCLERCSSPLLQNLEGMGKTNKMGISAVLVTLESRATEMSCVSLDADL